MAVTGNLSALDAIAAKVRALGLAPAKIAAAAAPRIAEIIKRQFAGGYGPYGESWAALAPSTLRKHGPPPLTDTGVMRASTRVEARGTTVVVSIDGPAEFHQTGTSRMPARPIVPNDTEGLPVSYELALMDAAAEVESSASTGL